MPEKTPSAFRLSTLARKRLARLAEDLDKSEPEVLELAITHLRGSMARDQMIWITVPEGSDDEPPKSHKRPHRAA